MYTSWGASMAHKKSKWLNLGYGTLYSSTTLGKRQMRLFTSLKKQFHKQSLFLLYIFLDIKLYLYKQLRKLIFNMYLFDLNVFISYLPECQIASHFRHRILQWGWWCLQDYNPVVQVCYKFVDFSRDRNRIGKTCRNYVPEQSVLPFWSKYQLDRYSKSKTSCSKKQTWNLISNCDRASGMIVIENTN